MTASPEHTDLRGVLLDIDGTLVLSNEAHAAAWSEALAEAGHDIPTERIVGLIGMGGDRVLPTLVPGLQEDDPAGERILDRRREIFQERHAPHLGAAPGARDLVARLIDEGFRLVVASSAAEDELGPLLDAAGIRDLVDRTTTSDDAASSKPAPDIVEAALKSAGLRPDRSLMLGDTPYDVESAGRAGVPVVAVRCGGWSDDALRGALAVYDDPADVLARFETSPFARLASGRAGSLSSR